MSKSFYLKRFLSEALPTQHDGSDSAQTAPETWLQKSGKFLSRLLKDLGTQISGPAPKTECPRAEDRCRQGKRRVQEQH